MSIALSLITTPAAASTVTGTVQGPGAIPVENVNVDFIDRATGDNVPIATGDFTNVGGTFTVDVPDGSYDVTYSPPAGSGLAGNQQLNITVSGATALPTATLPAGFAVTLRTVDLRGTPLPGIDADFEDGAQQTIFTPTDSADAAGVIATVVPQTAGPYTMILRDLTGGGLADKELVDFQPTADIDLGEIVMGFAQLFTGRTVRFITGTPVASVEFDAIDESGLELRLQGDVTDASGNFSAGGLSDGRYELIFRPPPATGLYRKTLIGVTVGGPLLLGDVELGANRTVSGRTVDGFATPLSMIDLNFRDQTSGFQLETNNDDSLIDGTFAVVVTDGIYSVDFRPLFDLTLAPLTLFNVTVIADLDLGDVVLGDAVFLSGLVTDSSGVPVAGADLDVFDPVEGLEVFTPEDDSDSTGNYSARFAPGTWDLVFAPPAFREDLGLVSFPQFDVFTNQTLNVVLQGISAVEDSGLYR
jgi:hypothetical protein